MSISPWFTNSILDQNLKFTTPGLNVYLRTKKTVEDSQEFVEYGFQIAASGSDGGFIDTLIDPPPSVQPLSLHNIGLNSAKLMFGAHSFDISQTFVQAIMDANGYTDGYQVFRDPSVIGIIYNNRMFSLESIYPESVNNEIIRWIVLGNAHELVVPT